MFSAQLRNKEYTGKGTGRYQSSYQRTFIPNYLPGLYFVSFWEECHMSLINVCIREVTALAATKSGKRKLFLI